MYIDVRLYYFRNTHHSLSSDLGVSQDSKGHQEKADSLGDRFRTLATDIKDFTSTFATFADARRQKSSEELNTLNADIAAAKERLSE